jgi:hypothetical protein
VGGDDLEAFGGHPAGVRGVLLGGELRRQVLVDEGVLGHVAAFLVGRTEKWVHADGRKPDLAAQW